MRVQNRRKAEEACLQELVDVGVPFGHHNRMSSFWSLIPEPRDEKTVSAWSEYHNKTYWDKRCAQNDEHYTRNRNSGDNNG